MRRLLAVIAVAGVALACLVLPAAGQTAPTISISPTSDAAGTSGTWSITVTGAAWPAGRPVSVSFAGTAMANPTADRSGGFTVTITPTRRYAGTYQVTGFNNVCAPTASCPRSAAADFQAVPSSTFNDPCGNIGATVSITITGSNFPPKSYGYVYYDPEGPDQDSASRIPTNSGTFSATFSVVIRDRPITIMVYDVDGNTAPNLTWRAARCPVATTTTTSTTTTAPPDTTPSTTTVTTRPGVPGITTTTLPPTIEVPPPTPGATLTVMPKIGPPGFVTGVVGTGFPPGPVQLVWSPGIGTTTAIAGPDGSFSTRVLIFPRDRLGPRALIATGGAVSAFDGFLVVPATVHPSSGREVAQITRIRRFTQR